MKYSWCAGTMTSRYRHIHCLTGGHPHGTPGGLALPARAAGSHQVAAGAAGRQKKVCSWQLAPELLGLTPPPLSPLPPLTDQVIGNSGA